MGASESNWPDLSAERDGPTIVTLHLFSQVIGKVPTALLPWRNHGWQLTLHLGPRGFATEPVHAPGGTFALAFDLVDHRLRLERNGPTIELELQSMAVADFHGAVTSMLSRAGHEVKIHAAPNEVDPATPFAADRAPRTYDRDSAARLLGAFLSADRVMRLFRSGFLGKVSPVHLFWGSFDLAVTRFSGRAAPRHPGGIPNLPDDVTREAYSHEVSSAGFWPGGAGAPGGPFFYSYAYPPPPGFGDARVEPAAARFDSALGEFILDYDQVRRADDPDRALLAFLESSYRAAAELGDWDKAALECALGEPGKPRAV